VLVDVPKDVQNERIMGWTGRTASHLTPIDSSFERGAKETPTMSAALDRAAGMLNGAERPVLMVGRGVLLADVVPAVRRLAEWAELPVVTSLLGLDGFPARHPLALGLPGMHGTPRANSAIQEADLVLGLGIRLDDRVVGRATDFAPQARLVHFEIDPTVVGRTVRTDHCVLGDLAVTLPGLIRRVRPRTRPSWLARLKGWDREAEAVSPLEDGDGPLRARDVIRAMADQVSQSRAIVVTDVGQHQMWLAQELPDVEPGAHLTSGGLGTMGYALPAGIGAAVARPDREVWVIAGDGGFQMNVQEMATVVQERLRLRIAVVNNGFLGMVRQWQELFYERRYSASEITGPNFVALAEAYGIPGIAVDRKHEISDALAFASGSPGPALVDLRVAREENVYPIVPSGAALHEFVTDREAASS
jgi:acetolactate synthase-1/2/3 large subunit